MSDLSLRTELCVYIPGMSLNAFLSISNINTYFTGTIAGANFAITLPTASSNIDGLKYVIMSTINRPTTTWVTPGGSIVGAPSSLTANTPVCFQYNNSNTTWYISM